MEEVLLIEGWGGCSTSTSVSVYNVDFLCFISRKIHCYILFIDHQSIKKHHEGIF